jgi:hypothetical protein
MELRGEGKRKENERVSNVEIHCICAGGEHNNMY